MIRCYLVGLTPVSATDSDRASPLQTCTLRPPRQSTACRLAPGRGGRRDSALPLICGAAGAARRFLLLPRLPRSRHTLGPDPSCGLQPPLTFSFHWAASGDCVNLSDCLFSQCQSAVAGACLVLTPRTISWCNKWLSLPPPFIYSKDLVCTDLFFYFFSPNMEITSTFTALIGMQPGGRNFLLWWQLLWHQVI